ncbi:MAG TPA: hypothetical protein VK607_23515 [Kofleriaceae bacterium]|nr:hypothetical protein [Kofleriaceae bacterium]
MTRKSRTPMIRALRACSAIALAIAAASATARADVSAASRAFADGQSAQLEGDYDHAAQSFELAFSNAPSKEALRSAVRARQLAGQLARAATLAEILLAKYPDDAPSAKLANEVIGEARPKFARVTVVCTLRCSLAVGGRAMSLPAAETQVVYVAAGRQSVEATFDDAGSATKEVTAVAGADADVKIAPLAPAVTPAPRPAAPSPPRGLSPLVPLVGAAITLGVAGAGLWSGLDTNKAHDAYAKNPTHEAFTQGQSKQLRTNILFGSAIAVGAVTAAIAIWWTKWDSGEKSTLSLAPSADGAVVTYGAVF